MRKLFFIVNLERSMALSAPDYAELRHNVEKRKMFISEIKFHTLFICYFKLIWIQIVMSCTDFGVRILCFEKKLSHNELNIYKICWAHLCNQFIKFISIIFTLVNNVHHKLNQNITKSNVLLIQRWTIQQSSLYSTQNGKNNGLFNDSFCRYLHAATFILPSRKKGKKKNKRNESFVTLFVWSVGWPVWRWNTTAWHMIPSLHKKKENNSMAVNTLTRSISVVAFPFIQTAEFIRVLYLFNC